MEHSPRSHPICQYALLNYPPSMSQGSPYDFLVEAMEPNVIYTLYAAPVYLIGMVFFAIINSFFISGYATRSNLLSVNISIVPLERTFERVPSDITRTFLIPDNADRVSSSFGVDDMFASR